MLETVEESPWTSLSKTFFDKSRPSESIENIVIHEGDLNVVVSKNSSIPVHLLITTHYLKYAPCGKSRYGGPTDQVEIDWAHVIGCHCLRGKRQGENQTSAFFCVYAYAPHLPNKTILSRTSGRRSGSIDVMDIKISNGNGNGNGVSATDTTIHSEHSIQHPRQSSIQLKRCVLTFEVKGEPDNMKLAKEYQSSILSCIHKSMATPFKDKKPYLILINPKSGPGKAFQLFKGIVNPIFGEADIPYKLLITEHQNHAFDMVRKSDLSVYRGLVVVSGDGLMYEVINGLFSRSDWRETMRTVPLGIIAGGSGNALAVSVCFASGYALKTNIVAHNALMLVAPRIKPMDLVLLETTSRQRSVSFLSITWGMISHIDINSEPLRALGEARFAVAAMGFVMKMPHYRATLSFLPVDSHSYVASHRQRTTTLPASPSQEVIQATNTFRSSLTRSTSVPTSFGGRSFSSVTSPLNSTMEPCQETEEGQEGENHVGDFSGMPDNLENIDKNCPSPVASDFSSHLNSSDPDSPATLDPTISQEMPKPSCDFKYCTDLDSPVPQDWVVVNDDFLTVCGVYQTHLSSDTFLAPKAKFNDGVIYLIILRRSGMNRSRLLHLVGNLEKGGHENTQGVEIIPVKAFRLDPDADTYATGVIAVDGEKVDYGPIQAEVLPEAARFMAGPSRDVPEGISGPLAFQRAGVKLQTETSSSNASYSTPPSPPSPFCSGWAPSKTHCINDEIQDQCAS